MTNFSYHFQKNRYYFFYFKKPLSILILLICFCCSKNKAQNKNTVYVEYSGNGWELFRNNKPFLIKGASASSRLKELKDAGANTVRIYDTTNLKTTLDSAHFYDLAVIVDLPIARYQDQDTVYDSQSFKQKQIKATLGTVEKHRHHQALLYWILGNEVNYPDNPIHNSFVTHYNELLETIRLADPNHPISTSVGGFNRSKVLAIKNFSPIIDLISINIFGELSTFQTRRNNISLLWDGPYVLTEFGVNGPWEANKTTWSAPIEETSTKKAEQYYTRYHKFINDPKDERCLGSLFFYWGNKQERTHTWFSTFDDTGKRNQAAMVMENIWKQQEDVFEGPKIKYIVMNGLGANESIVLTPGETVTTELLMENPEILENAIVTWEIRKENWNYLWNEVEKRPKRLNYKILKQTSEKHIWQTPMEKGPYRIFVTVTAGETFATSNIPFYILP